MKVYTIGVGEYEAWEVLGVGTSPEAARRAVMAQCLKVYPEAVCQWEPIVESGYSDNSLETKCEHGHIALGEYHYRIHEYELYE